MTGLHYWCKIHQVDVTPLHIQEGTFRYQGKGQGETISSREDLEEEWNSAPMELDFTQDDHMYQEPDYQEPGDENTYWPQ